MNPNSTQKANNTSFVNFFSNESLTILNQFKNTLKNDNHSSFMRSLNNEQKIDLLNFIFSLSEEQKVQDQNDTKLDLKKIRDSLTPFEKMKVPQLKAYCKEHGLKTSGTKWDLVTRIQVSQINFNQFDSSCIEDFKNWAGPFMSVNWNEGCLCNSKSVNKFKKTKNDKNLLDFISRIIEDKDLYFIEDAIIEEILENHGSSYNEHDWRFADSYLDPQMAVLAWILSFDKCSGDTSISNKRKRNESLDELFGSESDSEESEYSDDEQSECSDHDDEGSECSDHDDDSEF